MGWLYATDSQGAVRTQNQRNELIRCGCQSERRRRYLESMDGLLAHERGYHFADALAINGIEGLMDDLLWAVERRRGLFTLTGNPGVGKTHLLMCVINEARDRNVPAVYTTMTDVLDYLRNAYHPNTDLTFDARWELLTSCEVLALDELTEFNTTPWAMERFLRLMDERWRNLDYRLTLCATNDDLDLLPPKVASRLRDRRARVVELQGVDLRLAMTG